MKDRIGSVAIDPQDVLRFPPVETHLLRSKHVAQTYKIQVMQPGRKDGDTRRYPVVYITDGNFVFDMFKDLSYLLQLSARDAPPFILVGIGYPSDFTLAGVKLRARDFTFPPYPQWQSLQNIAWDGVLLAEPGSKDFYGGEDFRRFIGTELIPFIDERYATAPGDRTYFGHSGGGFFGLQTLFTQPDMFRNYIVSSPGVIYHGEAPGGAQFENNEFGLAMAREFMARHKSLNGVKLYMSAGAEEEFEPDIAAWRLTSSLTRLAKVLHDGTPAGLELMTEIIPGETHITVWPIAFTHGVQAMLGTRRVARSVYFQP